MRHLLLLVNHLGYTLRCIRGKCGSGAIRQSLFAFVHPGQLCRRLWSERPLLALHRQFWSYCHCVLKDTETTSALSSDLFASLIWADRHHEPPLQLPQIQTGCNPCPVLYDFETDGPNPLLQVAPAASLCDLLSFIPPSML